MSDDEADIAVVDDALLRLRRLWSASRSPFVDDDDLTPVDISSLIVVEACARGAAAGTEVVVRDVADLADVAASTASRLVDRAVRAGLLHRVESSISARRTALQLTTSGTALRERALSARTTWLREQLKGWDQAETKAFGELLARFADGLTPLVGPATHPSGTD